METLKATFREQGALNRKKRQLFSEYKKTSYSMGGPHYYLNNCKCTCEGEGEGWITIQIFVKILRSCDSHERCKPSRGTERRRHYENMYIQI